VSERPPEAGTDRPGTVYRSRPRLFRRNEPLQGPPFLDHRAAPGGPAVPAGGYATPPGGAYSPAPQRPAPSRPSGPPPAAPGSPSGPQPGYGPPSGPGSRRRVRLRWWWIALPVALLLVAYPILLFLVAWSGLNRVAALPADAPAQTPGRTYLVVGSDSREQLTAAQRRALHTGQAGGRRTDTIMLLHVPDGDGPTVLVSVPRDSYVAIPGHGKNKINAAYAFGGPQLLVRTVEQATGLHVDSYVETGLGGYAQLVDAIGGIDVCVKRALKDAKAHINVKAGCQTFDGATALGYARARYADPRGDLGRVERQRQVLAAIAGKTLSPSVVALPWRAFPAASAGAGALTVDQDMSPTGLLAFVQAMRAVAGGGGLSLTVPVGNAALQTPNAGEAVQWNSAQAGQLFDDLRRDDTNAIKPLADAQKKAAGS
jgi:LCP family protein required for cell wall assembly